MKSLLATAIIALPAMAIAQDRIPENVLNEQKQSCVSRCTQNQSEAYCAATCDCVADEMRSHWTADEYEMRADRLSEDGSDPAVRNELEQIAGYCAKQTGQLQ